MSLNRRLIQVCFVSSRHRANNVERANCHCYSGGNKLLCYTVARQMALRTSGVEHNCWNIQTDHVADGDKFHTVQ